MLPQSLKQAFNTGIGLTLGILAVIGVISLIYFIVTAVMNYLDNQKDKAKFVMDNWDNYIRKGYFEELSHLNKYKSQIKNGEWPSELEDMFEWTSNGNMATTDSDGDIRYMKKNFLTLKKKYKKKENKEPKDNKDEDKQ